MLLDPRKDNAPFHVGKGHNSHRRDRIAETLRCQKNPLKKRVISRITEAGLTPGWVIVASGLSEAQAFELEKELIAKYGRRDKKTGILCNLTDGGEGASGYLWTDQDRERQRRRMLENNPMKGRTHTEATRNKIAETRSKRTYIPRRHSPEHIERLRRDNPGGKATAKPVYQISEDGRVLRIWPSAQAAAESLHLQKSNLCAQSKDGSCRLVGGFWWRRIGSNEIQDGRLVNVEVLNARRVGPKLTVGINKCDLDGKVLETYGSIMEASNANGLKYATLWAAMKHGRVYGGYRWTKTD